MKNRPIRDIGWTQARDIRRELESETKDRLLDAARSVFSAQGYDKTTIGDITSAAEISRPSFYVYFASKSEVFCGVAAALRDDILEAHHYSKPLADHPVLVARASIDAFIRIYIDNLELLDVIDKRAHIDPKIAEINDVILGKPVRRILRQITGFRESGLARPHVDVEYAAHLMDAVIVDAASAIRQNEDKLGYYIDQATRVYFAIIGFTGDLTILDD